MNNQMLQLQILTQLLHDTIQQLWQEDILTPLDRDYLKQQCISIYDQVLRLKVSTSDILAVESKQEPVVTENYPVTQNTIQAPLFEQSELSKESPPLETLIPIKTETEIKNSEIDQILETQQKNIPVQEPKTDFELSLHEKLAHLIDHKENFIEKLSASIPSLKNAINVNLKIAFVNQLFNENTVEYVKAIDRLNSCENIHEAMRYYNELKHTYNWETENANVKELEQLINKRYNH
jgi:hypothetical protein